MCFDGSVTVKVCRGGPCGCVWYSVGWVLATSLNMCCMSVCCVVVRVGVSVALSVY